MLEIHKQYVLDENGEKVAVQISIAEFERIEAILNHTSGLMSNDHNATEQAEDIEDPFKEKNGFLELMSW